MRFEPKSGEHAIVEAVFGLRFAKPFDPELLEKVVGAHDEWREMFPRLSRGTGFQFQMGDGPAIPVPGTSVVFDQLMPDGSFKWRLRFEGNSLWLNCLAYTRWQDIWAIVSKHIFRSAWLATSGKNSILAVVLQYIDVFEWTGRQEDYNAALLLKKGAAIPATILDKGPLWHLHQGWFRAEPRLPRSSLLERVHLDAVKDDHGRPIVRLDTYLEARSEQPIELVGDQSEDQPAAAWFEVLHDLDKQLLRSVLTKGAAKRIKLNV